MTPIFCRNCGHKIIKHIDGEQWFHFTYSMGLVPDYRISTKCTFQRNKPCGCEKPEPEVELEKEKEGKS